LSLNYNRRAERHEAGWGGSHLAHVISSSLFCGGGGIVSHVVNPRDQGRVQQRKMGKCGASRTPRRFAARSDRGTVGASARGIPHSACHSERAQASEESPRPSVSRPAGAGEAQLTACHRQGTCHRQGARLTGWATTVRMQVRHAGTASCHSAGGPPFSAQARGAWKSQARANQMRG